MESLVVYAPAVKTSVISVLPFAFNLSSWFHVCLCPTVNCFFSRRNQPARAGSAIGSARILARSVISNNHVKRCLWNRLDAETTYTSNLCVLEFKGVCWNFHVALLRRCDPSVHSICWNELSNLHSVSLFSGFQPHSLVNSWFYFPCAKRNFYSRLDVERMGIDLLNFWLDFNRPRQIM